jgi:hypothetical protein
MIYDDPKIRMEGVCEIGLDVRIDSPSTNVTGICESNGNFSLTIDLPSVDGQYPLVIRSVDGVGNTARVDRLVTIDLTSPDALLGWYVAECDSKPANRIIGDTPRTPCQVVGEVAVIDDDIESWSLVLSFDGIEEERINGTSSWDGSLRIEAKDASEGMWTLSFEMQDYAGNNRTLSTSIDIQGREATSSEMLVSFGSSYNILAISVIAITGIISWISFRREPEEIELDFVEEISED